MLGALNASLALNVVLGLADVLQATIIIGLIVYPHKTEDMCKRLVRILRG